ncbi:arginine biosynthesis bifunctional protein ArgJ [Burkholderia sp. THE68]|uniref:bifunctional glutamate N-acetyltransferase/amino-acid acetyltransferase ArgJ n=1 Tax=Burkholderia sp. THE68 TaxID=758782 RepID=UPI0013163099|nr:bifunctional glutamate N-acetyltransferase/amino-acid acetyltransferase ArgJ [Burkholderia sp. THE68]BBU26766.1 arginine biosynthesis bifunctional protein ArgJ [Burkholderia sp. THE68]
MKDRDFISLPLSDASPMPRGFRTFVASAGIKDASRDVAVMFSDVPCAVAGVYTRSHFASPAVRASRRQLIHGSARALLVVSKNANVATGPQGVADLDSLIRRLSGQLAIAPDEVQSAATGVIGRRLPVDKIAQALPSDRDRLTAPADFRAFAETIMTTDTTPKAVCIPVGNSVLVGVAKGVGMIEPDMATLLVYFFTDAQIAQPILQSSLASVIDETFNCITVDSDTSTSDSCAIFANGLAGPVDADAFKHALVDAASHLATMVMGDGEGVTRIFKVIVERAESATVAKAIAKSIANSPLVKTAIHGNDPNWGRVAMAIGKCDRNYRIDPERTRISICGIRVYPSSGEADVLAVRESMRSSRHLDIHVDLAIGDGRAEVLGCDLSPSYVELNSHYTT